MGRVSNAARSAPARLPEKRGPASPEERGPASPEERGPASLLPAWAARLMGFAPLACLGVSQWQRMVAGLPLQRPLLWVALALAAAGAVLASVRLPERHR